MTCIAWDGETLAADRRSTTSDGSTAVVTKIFKFGELLYGVSGDSDAGREMRMWHAGGRDPEKFPNSARKGEATMMVIGRRPDGVLGAETYCSGPYPMTHERMQHAIGCGRDFAMAAMLVGLDAAGAVGIACELSAFCGNGIDTLTLEG